MSALSSPAAAAFGRLDAAMLRRLVAPINGDVFAHAPADRPFELEALAVPDDGHDRWSSPGTSTIYLAGDPLIALAEFARHGDPRRSDDRRIVRLRLAPTPVLDLRRPAVLAAIGVDPERCGADRTEARSLSGAVRDAGICAGLVVPSMAFRDDPQRFNVVLFAEAVDSLADRLREPAEIGRVTVRG
ncbi:MAG TPA: RES family NAD+ phosphorylase [Candidatus Limnocylindrales bacterium]|jgi:RES domain-containing protein